MRELDSPEEMLEQEKAIRQMVQSRLAPLELIHPDQQEAISYRLAEIMVASRNLYTKVMPSFVECEGSEDEVFEVFGEVRMNLLHIKDLVEDFEEAFLHSLSNRQDEADDEE